MTHSPSLMHLVHTGLRISHTTKFLPDRIHWCHSLCLSFCPSPDGLFFLRITLATPEHPYFTSLMFVVFYQSTCISFIECFLCSPIIIWFLVPIACLPHRNISLVRARPYSYILCAQHNIWYVIGNNKHWFNECLTVYFTDKVGEVSKRKRALPGVT